MFYYKYDIYLHVIYCYFMVIYKTNHHNNIVNFKKKIIIA